MKKVLLSVMVALLSFVTAKAQPAHIPTITVINNSSCDALIRPLYWDGPPSCKYSTVLTPVPAGTTFGPYDVTYFTAPWDWITPPPPPYPAPTPPNPMTAQLNTIEVAMTSPCTSFWSTMFGLGTCVPRTFMMYPECPQCGTGQTTITFNGLGDATILIP